MRHQLDQPCYGVDDANVCPSDAHGAALANLRQTVGIYPQDQLGDLVRIYIQPETEIRFGTLAPRRRLLVIDASFF
jgi:hypothetical protein